jgi:hypothetical protein
MSSLLVATFDPHGSLAKLEIEDVATWEEEVTTYKSSSECKRKGITQQENNQHELWVCICW